MLYIITAVHNRKEVTKRFVDVLKKQTYTDIQLILVDDGSTDGTSEMVLEKLPNSTIIRGDGNLWWGGALHEAYQWVNKNLKENHVDYIMISNDDVIFSEKYLEIALKYLNKFPDALISGVGYGLNSGKILDTVVNINYKKRWNESIYEPASNHTGKCASTRSLFMRIDTFLKTGDFHPILLPHYGSDYEWTIRASRKKFRIYSFEDLRYYFDENLTGYNFYDKLTLKKIFSKRSITNPIYRMNYIFLTTPFQYLFLEIAKQIKRYAYKKTYIGKIIKNGK